MTTTTYYTTVNRVMAELHRISPGTTEALNEDADAQRYILEAIRQISQRIDEKKQYRFEPTIETNYYTSTSSRFDQYNNNPRSFIMDLDKPLLSVTTLIDADGTTLTAWDKTRAALDTADYALEPVNDTPHRAVRKLREAWNVRDVDSIYYDVSIEGVWGYRTDYVNAFVDSGDTIQDAGGIDDSVETITINSSAGDDGRQYTPRFSAGVLAKIENEYIRILEANTRKLTVGRAVNGSTAAAHANGTAISVWYPEAPIQRACTRAVAYMVKRQGNFSNASIDALGATTFPADLPVEVNNVLSLYPAWDIFFEGSL